MKPNEIIKAVEIFATDGDCKDCPFCTFSARCKKECFGCFNVPQEFWQGVLDIFKSKDTEIDILIRKKHTLQDDIDELRTEVDKQYEQARLDILGNMSDGGTSCHWCIEHHRNQAIKEFAERLKKEGFDGTDCVIHEAAVFISDIDILVKEMTEGEKDV